MPKPRHRSRLVARLIRASVPFLNLIRRPPPFPFVLADLRQLPAGSLGAETAAFLDQRRFDFLPKYETHDIIHTLLGYDTTTTGELRLQAFMLGNRSASLAGQVLFVLGALLLPELWRQLVQDFQRGRRADRLSALNLTVVLHEPCDTLRTDLRLS